MKNPQMRSYKIFEALFNCTTEINSEPSVEEVAMEDWEGQSHDHFTIKHEFESEDITIHAEIEYDVQHDIDPGDHLTPPDHTVLIKRFSVQKITCWIDGEEFDVPVTKRKSELIINQIDL